MGKNKAKKKMHDSGCFFFVRYWLSLGMQLFSSKCYTNVISSLYHVIYVFSCFFLKLRLFSPPCELEWHFIIEEKVMQWLNSVIPRVFIYFSYYKPLYSMKLPLARWELPAESDFFLWFLHTEDLDSRVRIIKQPLLWLRGVICESRGSPVTEISRSMQHRLTPWVQLPEPHWKSQLVACSSDYEADLSLWAGTLSSR